MNTKHVKMSAVAGGIDALGRLAGMRLNNWGKTRATAKLYGAVIEEARAYNAELDALQKDFPDGGAELERRLAAAISGEVELPAVSLAEADFAGGELPPPADMYALEAIIDWEDTKE